MTPPHRLAAALVALAAVALTGCSGEAASPSGNSDGSTLAFGMMGDPSEVDRTIEVAMLDAMAFEPASISVSVDETITFSVTNPGTIAHEFTIGDEAEQTKHDEEMADMGMGMRHDHPYSVFVDPGQTKEITWKFTEAGDFLYGCHVPGHYAAGMKGTLSVD